MLIQRVAHWNRLLNVFLDKADAALEKVFAQVAGDKVIDINHVNESSKKMKKKRRRMPISLRAVKDTAVEHGWIFFILFVIWFLGRAGVPFVWMFFCFLILVYKQTKDETRRKDVDSLASSYGAGRLQTKLNVNGDKKAAEHERDEFLARLGDVPSWVFFADWERAEWLNTIILRVWPYLNQYVTEFIKNEFANILRKQSSFPIELKKVDMGDEPIRIGSIKSYNVPNMARDEAILDIEVLYYGDAEFKVAIKGLQVGVANLKLRGTIRVSLKPLLSDLPLIGCITVSFVSRPEIDFDLTEAANVAEKLGLYHAIRGALYQVIDSMLVLPNRLPIRLPVKAVSLNEPYLKHPVPVGVIRVKVVEAKDLPSMDFAIGKMAKCDGFCELSVGNQYGKTRVIQDQSCPQWNESFDFAIGEQQGQPLQIIVYDADAFGKKDYVGKLTIDTSDVAESPGNVIDKWYHIYDTSRGKLHLRLTYFNLSDDPADFQDTNLAHSSAVAGYTQRQVSLLSAAKQDSGAAAAGGRSTGQINNSARHHHVIANAEHTALAYLYVQSAENLPRSVRDSEPDAKVKITVEEHEVETEVVKGCSARWDEVFQFLVDDSEEAVIVLEVVDKKRDHKTLATGNVKLKHLRNEPNMIWTKPLRLEHKVTTSSLETNLYVTIALRAMTMRKLDATAVADVTDGFFLYGAATRRDVSEADLASTFDSTRDKKNRRKSSSVNSLGQSLSKSRLRNSEKSFIAANASSQQLNSAANGQYAEAGNTNPDGSVRTTLRPMRGTASGGVPSLIVNTDDSISIGKAAGSVSGDGNGNGRALSLTPRSAADGDESSSALISSPSTRRRASSPLEPSRPAQFDDADVDPADAGIYSLGKIKLTYRYTPQRGNLTVVVHRCQNLAWCDREKHSSDPYVTLKVVPGVISHLQRSNVVKNNLNPTYDQTFVLPVSLAELQNSNLLVSVKNHRPTLFSKARKHIGVVALRLKDYELMEVTAVTAWFDLQPQKSTVESTVRQRPQTARSLIDQEEIPSPSPDS